MADNSVGNVNAFPSTHPEFPTKIHVFAIHEEYTFVESSEFFEGLSANEDRGPSTPGCLSSLRIIVLWMFTRLLSGFTQTDRRIAHGSLEQPFDTPLFQFRVRVQDEQELARAAGRAN